MTKIKTQNFLSGVIGANVPSSGDFSVSLSQTPTYTKGFITFEPASTSNQEVVYFHDRIGSTIYVKAENRPTPKAHSTGTSFQITNVAEMFNYLSENIDTLGYIEKVGGLNISIWGGQVYDTDTLVSISDTSLTLPASQTNYIYLSKGDYTIKQTLDSAVSNANIPLATVISGASSVSSITNTKPYIISGTPGDMDSSVYDPENISEQLVGLTALQTVSNKSLVNTNYIGIDTTPTSVPTNTGTMSWNSTEDCLDIKQANTTLQVGQELFWNARNNTGSTITNGSLVYATGTIGNSGRITIAPYIANGTIPSYYSLGITTEDITNGSDGKVTHFGKIRSLNTTGSPYSETWVDGDLLYAHPTIVGGLTKVRPASNTLLVAMVIHAHSSGTLAARIPTSEQITKLYTTVGFDYNSDYVCDGTADDVQIQAAIDATTTNGGTVLIKRGTYNLSASIKIKSNVRLIGEGAGTILKATSGIGGVIYQGDTIVPVNASVEDMVLDGNNVSNVSGVQIYKYNNLTFSGVTVKNINGSWGMRFGLYSADANADKSYELTIKDCIIQTVTNTSLEGIITVNTKKINILNNVIRDCDLTNASMVSIFLLCEDVKISGNHIENAVNDYGLLDLTGCNQVIVSGNTLKNTGSTGNNAIVNRNTRDVVIDGNQMTGNIGAGAGGAGIIVLDWSGTIDGHTNPNPYTEQLTISNNNIDGFYYGLSFSNNDSSTNCGWANVNIVGNQINGFDYSGITARFVSGRASTNWNIQGNIIIPRTSGDKIDMWIRGNASYKFTKVLIGGNIFAPTTSNNTTCIQIDQCDYVQFGVNRLEPRGTGTAYNLTNATNTLYTLTSPTP